MNGSIWVRPDSGNCNDVQVGALDLDSQQDFTATFGVASQDGNGWCNLTAHIPNMANQQPVLYVALASGTARMTGAHIASVRSVSLQGLFRQPNVNCPPGRCGAGSTGGTVLCGS